MNFSPNLWLSFSNLRTSFSFFLIFFFQIHDFFWKSQRSTMNEWTTSDDRAKEVATSELMRFIWPAQAKRREHLFHDRVPQVPTGSSRANPILLVPVFVFIFIFLCFFCFLCWFSFFLSFVFTTFFFSFFGSFYLLFNTCLYFSVNIVHLTCKYIIFFDTCWTFLKYMFNANFLQYMILFSNTRLTFFKWHETFFSELWKHFFTLYMFF